jgi:hypothetical protein
MCEFNLYLNDKVVETLSVDMSKFTLKSESMDLNFKKNGIELKIKFEIMTADAKLHAHLFEKLDDKTR